MHWLISDLFNFHSPFRKCSGILFVSITDFMLSLICTLVNGSFAVLVLYEHYSQIHHSYTVNHEYWLIF